MGEQTKNMLIGAFIIVACALFVSFVLFLKPTVGDEGQILVARFSDINNIGIGTRVLYAGRPVGEVSAIEVLTDGRKQKPDTLGRLYIYKITLRIDSKVKVYDTDEITIQTSGLLGEKSIGIVPKEPPEGQTPKRLTETSIVYADSIDPLANALVQISEVADEMERAFRLAADWFEKNTENLTDIVTNIKTTTGNLADSKGALGRLINEDDLYIRFSALMSKVDTILGDINQYGLLYSSNKSWQRTRSRRLKQLNNLDSPEGFRAYFDCEIDEITLSMSRISMLLKDAEASSCKEEIMDTIQFKKQFQDLKAQVDELSDNLKLFNTQLSEMEK
jgi:phospholipid/cholesterol/gamma-HCH transport system substrate-binding protein